MMENLADANLEDLIRRQRQAPDDYEANRDLGLFLSALRQYEIQGEPYLLKALSHGRMDDHTATLIDRLGHIFMATGRFEAAVELYKAACASFPGIIDFRFRLAFVLLRTGRYDESSDIVGESIGFLYERARKAAERSGGEQVHLLGPHREICRFFGETSAKIDLYLKVRDLGWIDRARPILLAPAEDISNRAMLEYWSDHIDVIFDPDDIEKTLETHRESYIYLDYYTLPDGRTVSRDVCHRHVQQAWEAEGRAPLLTLKDNHREKGWTMLGKLGVPRDAWLVCLHVREAGYHEEDVPWSRNRYRNAEISTYLPAIEAITERGGWVVRIGDPSMTPLSDIPGVADVACSGLREGEDWADMFCIAESRFYMGMATGPASIPVNFGVPVLGTNWFHLGPWPYAKDDLFLHKLLRRKDDGRILTIGECMAPGVFGALEPLYLDSLGVEAVDNSAEDIRDAAIEMIERLDGAVEYSEEDEALQAAWQAQGDPLGMGPAPRVARSFLRHHPELVAPPPVTR